jgi:hypothetical protein
MNSLETVRWDHSRRSSVGIENGPTHRSCGRMEPCCADAKRCYLPIPTGKGPQAARADVEAAKDTFDHYTLVLDIGSEHALS